MQIKVRRRVDWMKVSRLPCSLRRFIQQGRWGVLEPRAAIRAALHLSGWVPWGLYQMWPLCKRDSGFRAQYQEPLAKLYLSKAPESCLKWIQNLYFHWAHLPHPSSFLKEVISPLLPSPIHYQTHLFYQFHLSSL